MTTPITIKGNIGSWDVNEDQQLRHTQAGVPVINFRVADDHRATDAQGNWYTKSTSWYKVTIFGAGALNAFESFKVGTPLIITGTVEMDEYKNPSTSVKTITPTLYATDFGINMKYALKQDKAQAEPVVGVEPAH